MKSRELQRFLATATGRIESEIDQRCRKLREWSAISHGARGNSAPDMTIPEVALHILALASRRPADAYEVADRLSNCRIVTPADHPGLKTLPKMLEERHGGGSLVAMMLSVMTGTFEASGFDIIGFELHEEGHAAWMTFDRRSLKGLRWMFSTSPSAVEREIGDDMDRSRRYDASIGGSRLFISGAMLLTLAERIRGSTAGDAEAAGSETSTPAGEDSEEAA